MTVNIAINSLLVIQEKIEPVNYTLPQLLNYITPRNTEQLSNNSQELQPGKREPWLSYAAVAAYVIHIFVSPALSDFSPLELFFSIKPPDLLNLTFFPLKQSPNTYQDKLQSLKEQVDFIASILLDHKIQQSQDKILNISMYQKVEKNSD